MKKIIVPLTVMFLLTMVARADYVVFDNGEPLIYGYGNGILDRIHAEDFELTQDAILTKGHFWTLEGVIWDGTLEYFIFDDDNGTPGTVISFGDGQSVVKNATGRITPGADEYEYSFEFETPIDLDAGKTYWFGLHMDADYAGNSYGITWSDSVAGLGYTCYESLGGTLDNWVDSGIHRAFYLEAVPEPATLSLFSLGVLALIRKRGIRAKR
jgi:hypothetical protein